MRIIEIGAINAKFLSLKYKLPNKVIAITGEKIGGNGRIGRNFIMHALKNTNYKIINVDPSEDFSKNKSINKERYIHLKICLGLESSCDELLNFFKGLKILGFMWIFTVNLNI